MAKRFLGIATIAALSTIPANGTIARLKALGMTETDNEGSYYIQDDRNIFLNVANINNYADSVILEWGSNGENFGSSVLTTDPDDNTKAKGGFLKKSGDFVYGVYLGNESNTSSLLRGLATGAYAAVQGSPLYGADNQLDVFFGGKASSFKWAVNAVYSSDNTQGVSRDSASAIRGGLIGDKWDAFINLSTNSKSTRRTVLTGGTATAGGVNGQTQVHTFDGKMGLQLGGGYQLTDTGRLYAFVKTFTWEQFDSIGAINTGGAVPSQDGRGQQGLTDGSFMTWALGYGNVYEMGKGTLFTNFEVRSKEVELKYNTKAEAENFIMPLTVGYEYQTTSWLTLRGSVIQNVYGYRENNNYNVLSALGENAAKAEFGNTTNGGKATLTNSTDVRAGATLHFGKLKIDGLIGLGGTDDVIDQDENGVLDMDRLLARVGMVYSF